MEEPNHQAAQQQQHVLEGVQPAPTEEQTPVTSGGAGASA